MRHKTVAQLVCIAVALGVLCAGCSRDGKIALAKQYIYTGNSYLAYRKLDKALAEFEKALAVAPHHLPIYLRLGAVYTAKGQFAKAVESYRHVLEQDPESAPALTDWAAVLVRQGRLVEALPKYEQAAEIDPEAVGIFYQWGDLLVRLRRNAGAVTVFERADEIEPDPPADALVNWGTALQRLGKLGEARLKYEYALGAAPDHVTALNNLGLILAQSESERDEGIRLLERAVKTQPANPAYLHNLGWAYLQAKRYGEAYNLLQRSVAATEPSSPLYEERVANLRLAEAQIPRSAATKTMPNVLLIVLDTLRADHLSSYGYSRNTTPNIDAVAAQGALFENAISQAPWTAPSVASLFTGLYPSVHGLDGGIRWGKGQKSAGAKLPFAVQKVLSSSQLTLAEGLRRHGYATAGFVSNLYVNSIFGFSQGFETYNDEHESYSKNVANVKRRGEETNKEVFEWLGQEPQEPFFLFVHYNDPHWPYNPPSPFGDEYVKGYRGDLTPARTPKVVETLGRPITNLSQEDLDYIIGLYDGETAYVDAQVGKLLEKIDSIGFEREFLTVIVADHGEEFLDHGSASHGYTLYEEMIRVPLIVRYPRRVAPARIKAQVRVIDIMPTLFEFVGTVESEQAIQGRSFVPLLEGKTSTGIDEAFSEATYVGDRKSIRTEEGLKLIYSYADDDAMLFDLKQDPKERKSLLNGNGESPLGEPLREHLSLWMKANQATRVALYGAEGPDPEVVLDEETKEQLEALGYIQ